MTTVLATGDPYGYCPAGGSAHSHGGGGGDGGGREGRGERWGAGGGLPAYITLLTLTRPLTLEAYNTSSVSKVSPPVIYPTEILY